VEQTFEDFELIISDNASTDGTEEICREFADRDKRIRYYRQNQNFGAVRNFNMVFELSTGEYFKWMGYDDWLDPEFLASCVDELDKDPSLVLCYCHEKHYARDGTFVCSLDDSHDVVSDKACKRFHKMMWSRSSIDPTYAVIRRSALLQTGLISTLLGADNILAAELSLLGPFGHIPEHLSFRTAQPRTDKERVARIEPQTKTTHLEFTRSCLEFARIITNAKLNPAEQVLLLLDLMFFFVRCQVHRRLLHSGSYRTCPKALLEVHRGLRVDQRQF